MEKYKDYVSTVLDFMSDNHYSQHSLQLYQKTFEALGEYLVSNGLCYTPVLGRELLNSGSDIPFGTKGQTLHAAIIQKLNAVYHTGSVSNVFVSSRKPYSSLRLNAVFSDCLELFSESISTSFSKTQTENIHRRCRLFLKYLQSIGKEDLKVITYKDISDYHFSELCHLKSDSRAMEEGSLCHFLQFLFQEKMIEHNLHVYMYALETDRFIDISKFNDSDRAAFRKHYSIQLPYNRYHQMINDLIDECINIGYVPPYHKSLKRALLYFELFLDIHGLDYSPEVADIWLNSDAIQNVFHGSSWRSAKRALFLLKIYVLTGKTDFAAIHPHGITGLNKLPEWMLKPLMDYAELREREKLDNDTVKNDIYSILRFCYFLISENIVSFAEISADMLVRFNLSDEHASSEGKNACNARIRRFLRYLYRAGIITNPHLEKALGYSAVKSERSITILSPQEIEDIKRYINEAVTPLQLRDSAIVLLGTEMGIRGSDIVHLRISDICFKNRTIRFVQDKTDVEIQLAMPVSVGNAIFKYLKMGRPRGCSSDLLFISLKTPHRPLTRNVCFGTLKRIFPDRIVQGSGFHVTRKTFSTYKLRSGIAPERISSVMGQRTVKSLTPYLSLDDERLSMCPLSLDHLNIPMKGDF